MHHYRLRPLLGEGGVCPAKSSSTKSMSAALRRLSWTGSPRLPPVAREPSALSRDPSRGLLSLTREQGGPPGGPGHLAQWPRITNRRAQRQQEAIFRSESPRQAKLPGSYPTCARRHGQPAFILPPSRDGRNSQLPCRATERQRPSPAGNPQRRTKFSGQRDRAARRLKR